MIKNKFILFILSAFIIGCSTDNSKDEKIGFETTEEGKKDDLFFEKTENGHKINNKIIGDFKFSVDVVSSIDFLNRKNEKIDSDDLEGLKKESVLIFEITGKDIFKDILKSEKMSMSKDSTLQYIVGDLQKDMFIKQGETLIEANSVFYEGRLGEKNKIRMFFLFNNLDRNKEYKIIYNDHLFDQGLIKFKVNKSLES